MAPHYCLYFLFFLLLIVVKAGPSNINDSHFAEISSGITRLLSDALTRAEISFSRFSFIIIASLSSQNREWVIPFYESALRKYEFDKNYYFDSLNPTYVNILIDQYFRDFAKNNGEQAEIMINTVVLPNYPFLSQVSYEFSTAVFLNSSIFDINTFLESVSIEIFVSQLSNILALEEDEAQIFLKALLCDAKNEFPFDPEFKWHHAFLVNVPVRYFKATAYNQTGHHHSIKNFIPALASGIYQEIVVDSQSLADELLAKVQPDIYHKVSSRNYNDIIKEYVESSKEPVDLSYLWDPQLFYEDLLEVILDFSKANSTFDPHLKVL